MRADAPSGEEKSAGEVQREPPTKTTVTGSGSSLETERTAWVAWPLMSLMPKISEEGKEVETLTARLGDWGLSTCSSSSSSSCTG